MLKIKTKFVTILPDFIQKSGTVARSCDGRRVGAAPLPVPSYPDEALSVWTDPPSEGRRIREGHSRVRKRGGYWIPSPDTSTSPLQEGVRFP